ncbi:NAD(P)/FAD-dependent oxidoreductase [Natronobiforma cellulositropha]|uniref:NAD(P)/FAD-dependent oxidoreductase n=1 Tax=Natronobiforma cellulositropha TaxID=1679076 RepID=UPI0021D5763A|nr:FAD-dependent oxidoreductase [Natronobiforma cellulositropha]
MSDPLLADEVRIDTTGSLEVAVVGAGAVGTTAAYDLARRGATVTLYDRGGVASGASGRAAGVCYDAFADERDADIAGEAIERLRRLAGDETFPFVECPYVWFAREGDDRSAGAISDHLPRMQAAGVIALEMDAEALGDRFPSLRTDDVAVAGVAGAAGYTDPAAYTACLAAAATGAGATLETQTPVEVRSDPPRIVDGGRERTFDAVLVTAGAHTTRLLEDAGLALAMKPYRVQAAVLALEGAGVDEPMWYDATDELYLRPHPEGVLAGNGTETVEADPEAYDRDADEGFAREIRSRVAHRLPAVDAAPAADDRAWAGLCTATPDGDPLVGELEEGIYVATGFHGHGFMRAPAFGERVATQILADGGLGDRSSDGLDGFDPARFRGDESFEIVEGLVID